jgi:hypothetical protein
LGLAPSPRAFEILTMGKKKNKNVNVVPDTYIEADPVEASEEARKSGDTVPESALGKKLASAGPKARL